MAPCPTIADLFKAKAVTDEGVDRAVETYLAAPGTSAHPIADGYTVDLAAAVSQHGWARRITANPKANPILKRAAVQTAILLARATKARSRKARDRAASRTES